MPPLFSGDLPCDRNEDANQAQSKTKLFLAPIATKPDNPQSQ